MDQIASAMRRGQSDQERCIDEFLFHPLAMRKCDCFFVFVIARPVNNASVGSAARCAAGLFLGMSNNKNAAYPALIGRWICRLYCFFRGVPGCYVQLFNQIKQIYRCWVRVSRRMATA